MERKQQQGSKSVLEDKEKFERTASDQKLAHMGDKPKQPKSAKTSTSPKKQQR